MTCGLGDLLLAVQALDPAHQVELEKQLPEEDGEAFAVRRSTCILKASWLDYS